MGLKIRINYHLRLFLPIALCLCVVFGFIIWYQYKREAEYRAEILTQQLDLINRRVLRAYEEDQTLRPFNAFIASYFSGSRFEGVRISVYNTEGMLRYSLGIPIPYEDGDMAVVKQIDSGHSPRRVVKDRDDNLSGKFQP